GDDRGGDRRQERADDPRARVRPGGHAPLPASAGGERRLSPRGVVAGRAPRAAAPRARRGRGRRRAAATVRGVVRAAARPGEAGGADLRGRGGGALAHPACGAAPLGTPPRPALGGGGRLLGPDRREAAVAPAAA